MMEYTERQELLYKKGIRLLEELETASFVLFQRKLCIGYEDARYIFERMLEEGVAIPHEKNEYMIVLNKGEKL